MPRRTLRNTTALALGLSVALPHFTVAQTALIEEGPASLVMAQAETGNPPEVPPVAVEGTDESAEAVEAAEETPQPEADAASAEAPAGDAAPAPEAPAEPAEQTAAEAEPEAEAAAEPAAEESGDAVTAPEAATPEAQPEPEAQPDPVEAAEPEAEPEAEPAADAQPAAATAEPEAEPAAPQAEAAAEPPAEAAPEPAPEAPAPDSAEKAAEPEAQTADEPEVATGDAAQDAVETEAGSEATDGGMPSEADLARALAEEGESAADTVGAESVTAGSGTETDASAPAAGDSAADAATATAAPGDGAALSGTGEPSPEGEQAEARAVPEAEVPTTDIAREAAAGATPPAAAALAESAAPVTTSEAREVTDETSRSATEDFQTDLRGELRESGVPVVGGAAQQEAAQGTPAEAGAGQDAAAAATGGDDDDDRSNLEQVLRQAVLPALAGLAVGQLLSNDRQVALNTGDRVVVTRPDGSQEIIKDDNALLLRPGSTVQTEEYADGSTRTIVTREDGSQVVTIRDADLRVLRRTLVQPDGTTTALIDETAAVAPVDVANLPPPARPITVAPGERLSEEALREALRRETQVGRTFTLGQIRNIPEVRALVAPIEVQSITFDTGSAAIKPDQAQALSTLGRVIAESVRQNPAEIYMIEGHTDTVGADAMNLALSDRRAESVALALTEFFGVPPENMVVQGYGEQFLKVPQDGDIRANRRAAVRRITDLLARN